MIETIPEVTNHPSPKICLSTGGWRLLVKVKVWRVLQKGSALVIPGQPWQPNNRRRDEPRLERIVVCEVNCQPHNYKDKGVRYSFRDTDFIPQLGVGDRWLQVEELWMGFLWQPRRNAWSTQSSTPRTSSNLTTIRSWWLVGGRTGS